MGSLHWLILIPYYFFAALGVLLASLVLCRIVRLRASLNALVSTAIGVALVLVIVPLLGGWAAIGAYDGRKMIAVAVLTFLFALIDTLISGRLPLPLDRDLQEL